MSVRVVRNGYPARATHKPCEKCWQIYKDEIRKAAIVASRRGSGPWRFAMELVDRLLAILAGPNRRYATKQLMADGHSEDEVRGA